MPSGFPSRFCLALACLLITAPASRSQDAAPPASRPAPTTQPARRALDRVTFAQIAARDPVMQQLLAERQALQWEMASTVGSSWSGRQRYVMYLRQLQDAIEREIVAYAQDWQESQSGTGGNGSAGGGGGDAREQTTRLRDAFPGPVDLYLDPAELTARRPSITAAHFVEAVDVGGRTLLRFATDRDSWLIDPDRIAAVRTAR